METVALLLAAVALIGLGLTSVQVWLVARLLRPNNPSKPVPSSGFPFVSILKPLSGLDDELEENLASFAALPSSSYEVILSVASPGDPAVAVARRMMDRFPSAPFMLVVGGAPSGRISNPKVDRLVAASRHARGDVLFISDSNVRVAPGDIGRTIALFDDPSVGCVSNLFVGDGARSFGAAVESLHLLTFVLPGTALADAGGVPCVVGKSMAIRRAAHDAIGGFAAFSDVLAEDQAIGCAVRAAGYRVVLSPVVLRNVVVDRSLRKALARQARWCQIRHSFSKRLFAGEILLNPFAVALLACGAATPSAPSLLPLLAAFAGVLLFVRVIQAGILACLAGARARPAHLLLMPVKDLLQLATQLVPFLSNEIAWHGHRARLGPGTQLLPSRRHATA